MENEAKITRPALLFDFDGTLADTLRMAVEIINRIGPEYNLKMIDDRELQKIRKMDARELIRYSGLPIFSVPLLAQRVKSEMKNNVGQIKPFQNIPEVLQNIREQKLEMGIVTSNLKENVEKFLEANNLNYFSYIHDESNIFGKGRVLKKVIKENNYEENNVIYFGDEIRDIEAAREAGIRIVSVGWGFNDLEGLQKHDPDWLITSPDEILGILKNL